MLTFTKRSLPIYNFLQLTCPSFITPTVSKLHKHQIVKVSTKKTIKSAEIAKRFLNKKKTTTKLLKINQRVHKSKEPTSNPSTNRGV